MTEQWDIDGERDVRDRIEAFLSRQRVDATVESVRDGPVVRNVDLSLGMGSRFRKLELLRDDLARVMHAESCRVRPASAEGLVRLELARPKGDRQSVSWGDVAAETAAAGEAYLPVILGRDSEGNAVIEDLADMPHVLVAGSTGSGKSVLLNSMLLSLLITFPPEDLRMVLIDPKRLELQPYAPLPHLLTRVVTEPDDAVVALRLAVREMEVRYRKLEAAGVRSIEGYRGGDMPRIVLVVDEMADLMAVAGRQVEESVRRLTQMARAAGIHLILATQRPSVDVLTGVIKANVPARMGLRVTSGIDSKVILDRTGAERLLGHGDMLYTTGGEPRRVHGAYVPTEEVDRVVTESILDGEEQ